MGFVKTGGRFVKLHTSSTSSRDTFSQTLHAAPANMSFSVVDLTEKTPSYEALQYATSIPWRKGGELAWQKTSLFPASSFNRALSSLRGSKGQEAFVLTFDDGDIIDLMVPTKHTYKMHRDATYVIAGGLGGLGRAVARWLVSRGAHHLILISRSGPRTPDALQLLEELREQRVYVETPCCDVSDEAALKSVLSHYSERMPPIEGCIQTSMVMTEILFEEMDFPDWKATIDPKVKGSWNLHALLPKGLDFFILVSSLMGILGTGLLSGYNAGNTYQDALARLRVAQGERAVSIDLGGVVDGGFVAENTRHRDIFQRNRNLAPLKLEEICAVLDIYCDPNSSLSRNTSSCQTIIGISQPRHWKQGDAEPYTMRQPFWGHIHHVPHSSSDSRGAAAGDDFDVVQRKRGVDLAERIASAGSPTKKADVVREALAHRIEVLLGTPEDRLDLQKPLNTYGIDSLSAIDLRNWISKAFDVDLPVFEILGGATLASAGMTIAEKLSLKQ
ncbi:Uu.00g028530.m01.CDS01 [Anthostomella pinea]|uniref:Uu.00g028530.m01.CDS01 n=1 Tax=Anthostomella pinea TaxID=933095 RepID=A0AAI8V7Y8_9PEZI|nr:Uu.00g028530.m01.CDS01 [Anthostomella pinea]